MIKKSKICESILTIKRTVVLNMKTTMIKQDQYVSMAFRSLVQDLIIAKGLFRAMDLEWAV